MSASADLPDDQPVPLREALNDALGGPLGIAESALPPAAFVMVHIATGQDARLAATVALALAAALALARIVRRQTPVYAVSGVLGVGIAAYLVARTGRAETFFLPGLLLNIGYATVWAVSIVVRWPLLGVVVGALQGTGTGWREDPRRLRLYARASWIWVGVFLSRVAVQLPLYLAGAVVALGVARVAMGLPLYAIAFWLSWLLLRQEERASRGDSA